MRHPSVRVFLPLIVCVLVSSPLRATEMVKVRVADGVLVGERHPRFDVFRGIPYAQPPVGPWRWKPPQPVGPWSGERDALEFGPIACQPAEGHPEFGQSQSEDCLTLNVWAPRNANRAPVMVWIHGGGFRVGSGSWAESEGKHFAQDGVVLVTFNYRLGVFGFFAHPALTSDAAPDEPLGNYGLMDQVAALKWVHANIARFGGDPNHVTIFGASAGGSSVLELMTIPSAQGLFAKGIVESGGGWFGKQDLKVAEDVGIDTATRAGLPGDRATTAQLRALTPAELLKAAPRGVVVPIDGRLITETVPQAFRDGHEAALPLLIGSNSGEGSVMASAMSPAEMLALAPPQLRARYTGTDDEVAAALFGDVVMGSAARWIARQHSARAPTFLYYFSYVGKFRTDKLPGARHGDEVPYIFGNLTYVGGYYVRNDDRIMEKTMHDCWIAFARDGKPAVSGGTWLPYTAENDTLVNLDAKSGPVAGFKRPEYDVIEARMLKWLFGSASDGKPTAAP